VEEAVKAIRMLGLLAGFVFAASTVSAQTGQLEVDKAWARATPGKSAIGVAYVTIQSPTADKLVAVSSPVAKKAELHTMSMSGMVMKMRPIASIDIPAGQAVTLQPGGLHIMLVGLAKPLQTGQSFPLILTFDKAGSRTVNVTVQKIGATEPTPAPQH
jgi:periplasmic copper chaperone A